MIDIDAFMTGLAKKRPLFHSEADFQHALAWQLQQAFPTAKIRLEYPFELDKWIYIDIWSEISGASIAIELKYKTSKLQLQNTQELYHLKDQSAQDVGRYDFIKDIHRVEHIVQSSHNTTGIAILLTNDTNYWKEGRADTVDAAFRLHESRVLSGTLAWTDAASPGTTKNRSTPLQLLGDYVIHWKPYSMIPDVKAGEFRYVVVTAS